ncbi:MAG: N-acetyl-D-Glu racemase DgcA [Aliidongia sp.]
MSRSWTARSAGRGESVPYARYGETVEGVIETIESLAPSIETGMLNRRNLARELPPGAARNAIDLALWDFDAKRGESSVWQIAALDEPHRLITAYTISLDSPEAMARAAAEEAHRPLLKLKLGTEGDLDRVRAVRAAVPRARLIVDANEGWTPELLERYLPHLAESGVELVEQPLPAETEEALAAIRHSVPICADESCHVAEDLPRLIGLYDAINVKLDKAGGFTEALALLLAAREAGFRIMVGCMVGSSLAVAPAVLLAQDADWVDLDAPLLLARDRQPGLRFDGSMLYPASVSLWG